MLECPSCQQALPLAARFCTRCGLRLLAKTTSDSDTVIVSDSLVYSVTSQPGESLVDNNVTQEKVVQQTPSTNDECEPEENFLFVSVGVSETFVSSDEPYALEKRRLAEQCSGIALSMTSLLPFVYEDHRAENQALFASTLADSLTLESPVWGRVAFVLGAYGNYMYRYPLSPEQKRQVWCALLWAVFYERCYRRKYLAQRCQQLFHFFQGCAEDSTFQGEALHDLAKLSCYLEAPSLKKLYETLQQLPSPPADLLQRIDAALATAQEARQQQQRPGSQPEPAQRVVEAEKKAHPEPSAQHAQTHLPVSFTRGDAAHSSNEISPAARSLLGFLSEEQMREFFASLRTARLEAVNQLLVSVRQQLFTALLQAWVLPVEEVYQAPRRPIRLGKKHADRFAEARQLLASSRSSDQQVALRLFEQGARETTHPDYSLLAREWQLYARAIVQGSPRVIDDWESDLQRDEASWEEIWNLASFYRQTGYLAESLRVLQPAIDALRAPLEHLQLGLVCALELMQDPARSTPAVLQATQTFLLAHLEQWPHPLSCLLWLLLAYETHGPLHPRQQAQRLSMFQELIEHPLTLPDPQKELPETRVNALEKVLIEKIRCEEAWFFWINDYAERHPRKYQAWSRLAETSEHLGRLKTAEMAWQHLVEIQYQHDYAHYQEGAPPPRAEYLRRNLEKLFEFYQRHNLHKESAEAFNSCYPSLSHLWETFDPANRKLIALTRQHQEARQQHEAPVLSPRRSRDLTKTVTVPLEPFYSEQRVGIFIDYENIARFIPREMDAEEVGNALSNYAAQFGEVVCQWASASPQNLSHLADVRGGLELAGFKVRFPRRELQFSPSKKNLADFALLECLSDAQSNEKPDIYLIVSGDRDYYERVRSLLDAGRIVRVIAAADSQHLSIKYRELEQQRVRERQAAGHALSDFFIDNLEEILCPLLSLN